MNATHQCLVNGCTNPPTRVVETDAGLEGGLVLYYCEEHAKELDAGKPLDVDASRTEPDGATAPES